MKMTRGVPGMIANDAFKEGDRVKILPNSNALSEWGDIWVANMSKMVGKVYPVTYIDIERNTVRVLGDRDSYNFPPQCLELIREDDAVKEQKPESTSTLLKLKGSTLLKLKGTEPANKNADILDALDLTKFKVGDKVWVAREVLDQPGWPASWVDGMNPSIGRLFRISQVESDGYNLSDKAGKSDGYAYPDAALMLNNKDLKVGDMVLVTMDPVGWEGHVNAMLPFIGATKKITEIKGSYVRLDDAWNYPPYALRLVSRNGVDVAAQVPQTSPTKKAKRVRVVPGPWDSAPCTHLRWHLMGFFREKLALRKTKVKAILKDGTETEVELASVEVVCTKCNKSMTLNAK